MTLSTEVKTMNQDMESGATRDSRTETIRSPEEVPLYSLVPVRGPEGEILEAYRGVQRQDTKEIVSVMSPRYGLVQHADLVKALHVVGEALDKPETPDRELAASAHFTRESIKLYSNGRRMEMKLVIGKKFKVDGENTFFPAVRLLNSIDGATAVRLEAYSIRVACLNQLHASARSFLEFRELHLASADDLLGQLQAATHEILDHFEDALDTYVTAMHENMPIADFVPSLTGAGIPARHVDRMAQQLPEYFGSTLWGRESRWDLYQLATSYLTREVAGLVNPQRERQFERAAARALLLEGAGEGGEEVPA
ncbi:MAG: DUF932 domain-containing protein [Nitrososphaerota archaeon]|nr:DUF932 domain-containing protein [Nitrososphaerota archaeon]